MSLRQARVALFIPCFDAFETDIGIATLELLERFGLDVTHSFRWICCGRPMRCSGCRADDATAQALFVRNFSSFEYIVAPSGGCVRHVRENFNAIGQQADDVRAVRSRTYELIEFLYDILKVDDFPWAEFPHTVAYPETCQALRGIRHALLKAPFSKPIDLLSRVKGIEVMALVQPDDCCGLRGTSGTVEPAVSARMSYDLVRDRDQLGAEYIVSADVSCLNQQRGCAKRLGLPTKYIHIAKILNGARA